MNISEDTKEVIKFLDRVTGNNLRKRNDLGTILEIGASSGDAAMTNQIIFNSTKIWNLYSKIRKLTPESEGIDLLKKEFDSAIEETLMMLKAVITEADEDISERFDDIYFQKTKGAVLNLIDLAHDLAELKKVQQKFKNRSE